MKKIIIYALFFLLTGSATYSQYTVTKVVGKVQKKLSGEWLKPGSKVSDMDMLVWSSNNDLLRVIVPGKGIYVITPTVKSDKSNQLEEIVKSALKIKSKEGYLSGRSQKNELIPIAFSTDAGVNRNNVFVQENKYIFNRSEYDMSKGKLFLQIERPNNKPIIKQLMTSGDTLIIYANDLDAHTAAGDEKPTYTLGYYSKVDNTSKSLIKINPYIDNAGDMEAIIKAVTAASTEKYKSMVKQEVYSEVYVSLGKPSDITFTAVFDKAYADKIKK